jgi:ABC-type branched-subunit amino acid transport system substrate-binding protein
LYAGTVADLGKLKAKLAEAGLKAPILLAGDGEHLTALLADRETSNGVFVATPFVAGEGSPNSQEFARTYQTRFREAADVQAALAYDGIKLLLDAMRRTQNIQAAKLAQDLANADRPVFDSLTGPLTFNKYHCARRPLYVAQVEDGKLRRAKIYEYEEK